MQGVINARQDMSKRQFTKNLIILIVLRNFIMMFHLGGGKKWGTCLLLLNQSEDYPDCNVVALNDVVIYIMPRTAIPCS